MNILNSPLGQFVVSLVLLAGLAPVIVWFFRDTWATLDATARAQRQNLEGRLDPRTPATLVLGAFCLILINYFGSLEFFDAHIVPALKWYEAAHPETLRVCRATSFTCCRWRFGRCCSGRILLISACVCAGFWNTRGSIFCAWHW